MSAIYTVECVIVYVGSYDIIVVYIIVIYCSLMGVSEWVSQNI